MNINIFGRSIGLGIGIALTSALSSVPGMAQAPAPGSIVVVLAEEPQTLELCESGTSIRRITQRNVGEPLLFRDSSTQELNPGLATSWEQIDDTTWRFTIRDGVTFHDGAPLDADAVARSLNRTWATDLACGVNQQYFQGNTYTATAVDDMTVEIETGSEDAILPLRLSFLAISGPSTSLTEKTSAPVGTGPYQFEEWVPGQRIALTKFDDYWNDTPGAESVEYQWRQESAIRAAMAQTGEADLALAVAPQDVLQEDWDRGRAINFSVPEVALLRFDMVDPLQPINDLRVRKAINMAIDRQGFIDVVFNGFGEPATHIFTPETTGYDPSIPLWEYNPERARQLVAEARADGVDVENEIVIFGRRGLQNATQGMELIAAFLNEVGLNARVEMLGLQAWLDVLRSSYEEGRPTNMMQQSHGNLTGDAVFTFTPQYTSGGPFSALRDEELNQMVADVRLLSGEERAEALREISNYLYTELVPDAPIAIRTSTIMLSDRVNYDPNPASFEVIELSEITGAE